MNNQISVKDILIQSEGNIVSDMGLEKVMLSVENGKYYNLGELGGVIWEYLINPIRVQDLCDKLVNNYNVEMEECVEQTISFLNQMYNEGLVKKEQLIERP